MVNNSVNWGILGCGDVAEVKSGPAFQKVENSCLVTVMRRNKERVKSFAIRHQVANWTTSASDLLQNNLVNAVYIATPPSSHLQYALDTIQAGKNMYLEKPMVLNSQEAKVLLKAVTNSDVKVTVAFYRRELPVFVKVKEILKSNTIGEISSAVINIKQSSNANLIAKTEDDWRLNPEISGGGYFHDIAPHQIDLMCHYFGEVENIKQVEIIENNSNNNFVAGEVLFKSGVQFKGSWDFNASEDLDNCTIYGLKGSITFSFYGDEIIVSEDKKIERFQFTNPQHVQQPMIDKTVGYFLGNNLNPCSVNEAALVTEIMDVFSGLKQ